MGESDYTYYHNSSAPLVWNFFESFDCAHPDCSEPVRCRDMCNKHYGLYLQHSRSKTQCTVVDCTNVVKRRQLCNKHYTAYCVTNRCKNKGCNMVAIGDSFCKRHYKESKGTCSVKGCESTDIFNNATMKCKRHYHRDYRAKKVMEQKRLETNSNETIKPSEEVSTVEKQT